MEEDLAHVPAFPPPTPYSRTPLCPSHSPDTADMEGPWTSRVPRPVARVRGPPQGEREYSRLGGHLSILADQGECQSEEEKLLQVMRPAVCILYISSTAP